MQKVEVNLDVTDAVGTGEHLQVAATVVMPEAAARRQPVVLFAFPGGGYNRRYYDLQLQEGPDYSQAEYHAREGFVFVAIDHLGVGDSSIPQQPLDYEAVARANNSAARQILDRLTRGTLGDGIAPLETTAAIAIAQSFGGFMLIIAQGIDPCFDGVAVLGWSAIQTIPPWPEEMSAEDVFGLRGGNGLTHPLRERFHLEDVPDSIVIADMTKEGPGIGSTAPWSTDFSPGGSNLTSDRVPLAPGVVAKEAAAITVPVFVGNGEVDIVADFRSEPAAYRSSPDVTTCVFPGMAHMHNFATTRHALWRRLASWADCVADSAAASRSHTHAGALRPR